MRFRKLRSGSRGPTLRIAAVHVRSARLDGRCVAGHAWKQECTNVVLVLVLVLVQAGRCRHSQASELESSGGGTYDTGAFIAYLRTNGAPVSYGGKR